MRHNVLVDGGEISGNAPQPSRWLRNLTASGDDFRAFLAFGLAASLLSVYALACVTGAVSI